MGSSHLAHGATVGAWTAAAASAAGVPDHVAVLAGPVVAYAALWPDLDHPRSMATRSLGPVTAAVSWLLRLVVDHRGPTHTARGAAGFATAAAVVAVWAPLPLGGWSALLWWLAAFMGCVTHVYGDARTTRGVPWRGPDRVGLGHCVVGGRLRLGRTVDTGSPREQWRLRMIYVPVAVGSWAVTLLILRNG